MINSYQVDSRERHGGSKHPVELKLTGVRGGKSGQALCFLKLRGSVFLAMSIIVLLAAAQGKSHSKTTSACVDLALVLAVDGSSSIEPSEFRFQMDAIARTLRDPDVRDVMKSAGQMVVSVLVWGDAAFPPQSLGWYRVQQDDQLESLARHVEQSTRQVFGLTGLAAGIAASLDQIERLGPCVRRAVIDVSADGRETPTSRQYSGVYLREVRARAEDNGVTINALILESHERGVREYYEEKVVAGPRSFVMEARDHGDFATALKRKIIREIQQVAVLTEQLSSKTPAR